MQLDQQYAPYRLTFYRQLVDRLAVLHATNCNNVDNRTHDRVPRIALCLQTSITVYPMCYPYRDPLQREWRPSAGSIDRGTGPIEECPSVDRYHSLQIDQSMQDSEKKEKICKFRRWCTF